MKKTMQRVLPIGMIAGAIALFALAHSPASESSQPVPEDPFAALISERTGNSAPKQPWGELKVESFSMESKNEKAVFISLVQLVELERKQGDVSRAIPTLKDVATRSAKQQLRNATNRLLHDIHVELGNTGDARDHLMVIIEESLAQGA